MSITTLTPSTDVIPTTALAVYQNGARISPPVDRAEATRIAATEIIRNIAPKLEKRVKAKAVRKAFPALALIVEDIMACDYRKASDAEVAFKSFSVLRQQLRLWNKDAGRDGHIQFATVDIDLWNKA